MPNILTTFATTAAAVVFWEFIKRIGVRFTEAYTPPAIAAGLLALDRLLPQLLADGVTGDALRQWLAALEEAPQPEPEPAHVVAPGSFDPLATLDESDPNHQTRTVI